MATPIESDQDSSKPGADRGQVLFLVPALLVLVMLVVAGLVLIARFHVFGGGPRLEIRAARVTVDRRLGHCPNSVYNFTGTVISNGAGGPITYQWIKPDGSTTNAASATIRIGDKQWTARLQFTFQGHGQTTGAAILRVISPTDVKSPPAQVSYQCP